MAQLDEYTFAIPHEDNSITCDNIKKRANQFFSIAKLKRHIPIIEWLPEYNCKKLQFDIIAGITVGLTVIPQGMAYASVAGLPLQYGLYTAFMACFVYCVFGSTKEVTIGPTAIMGLLTSGETEKGGATYAVLLCFLNGIIILLLGVLNLGFLIDFIPSSVIIGFSSAAAIIIATTQLKGLLGLHLQSSEFLSVIENVFKNIGKTKVWDLSLGIVCIIILVILKKVSEFKWAEDTNTSFLTKFCHKFFWFIGIGRNALVAILMSSLAYVLTYYDKNLFTLTGEVQSGFPPFRFPDFSYKRGNETIDFLHILSEMGSTLGLVPLLAVLEHVAIAKVFTLGRSLDCTQELIALGLSNIMGSFVSSFPCTGSFSRTALNASCRVSSPIGGIFTGSLVLLTLGLLTETFRFIPKATLSAIIICAILTLVDYKSVPILWKTNKADFFLLFITFFSSIFAGAEYGVLIGTGFGLLLLLYKTARPNIEISRFRNTEFDYIILKPNQQFYYSSMEYVKHHINQLSQEHKRLPVVFDGAYLCHIDFTIVQGIKQLIQEFNHRNQKLLFINLKQDIVELIKNFVNDQFVYCQNREDIEIVLAGISQSDSKETEATMPEQSEENIINYGTF